MVQLLRQKHQAPTMKKSIIIIMISCLTACIPLRIAPSIESHKIMKAKKFKRHLPRETSFIFEEPKDANEFYDYINTKFELNHVDVGFNTLFQIDGKNYYLTYSEVDIPNRTLNLIPLIIDLKRQSKGNEALFQDHYVSRKGNWYLVLSVHDDELKNCLLDAHPNKVQVVAYLERMRNEYIMTHNYLQVLLTQD